jgi:phage shock protein PspC (stress-responsive transcriptional regulator)
VNPRRLHRSRDRQLAGVAGGMAEYLDIDPTIVRILWILVGIFSGGLALVAYIILALVIPQSPFATAPGAPAGWAAPTGSPAGWSTGPGAPSTWTPPPAAPGWSPDWSTSAYAEPRARRRAESRGIGAGAIVGVVLIVFGAIALADAALPGWVGGAIVGPAVILALGAALLVSSIRRQQAEVAASPATPAPAAPAAPVAPATTAEAAPWDVTDTQPVDAVIEPGDPGARPA